MPRYHSGVIKLRDADYRGMTPSKWPRIEMKHWSAFCVAQKRCETATWCSKRERAKWQWYLHCSFGSYEQEKKS